MTKLFTALLGTETNTFSWLPTGLKLFEETLLHRHGDHGGNLPLLAKPLTVWRQMAEQRNWEVVDSLCAFATPAGKTTKSVYENFRTEILADLKAAMPVDAVMLCLHGAMVAEGYDDAEGDLLMHVRRLVGPTVPIGAEFDLHGNIGSQKLDNLTAAVLYKEYPHVDIVDRARELFILTADALDGKTKPVMSWFDCRTVGVFHTTRQPMRSFVDKCAALEGKDGILSVSIIHGFPWADVSDMGSKILVVADGDKQKSAKLAEKLGMEFFNLRHKTQPSYTSLQQAIERAASHQDSQPIVIADVSDNAGGGATSDSTFMLDAMLKAEIKSAAIGMFWDPMAVRIGIEAGDGAEIDIRLGGKLGPGSGMPLDLRAKVVGIKRDAYIGFGSRERAYSVVGDMVAFEVNGIAIVCNSARRQCYSLDCFTNVGIDPSKRKVVVVKSMQHFHADFAPIAAEILYCATPGGVMPDFTDLPYTKISKNQWPFVEDPFAQSQANRSSRNCVVLS